LLMERGAEVDPLDNRGWTPLYSASQSGRLEVSRLLLDHGANVMARQPRTYWTPAHVSAANGYLEIVKLLLERGADVHAMNDGGLTPYQVSLRQGKREVADLLRKHGAGRESKT
jgi:ankyrin repeat protein